MTQDSEVVLQLVTLLSLLCLDSIPAYSPFFLNSVK
jgi:hypothetical protein